MIDVNVSRCDQCATCIAVCRYDALVLNERLDVDPARCKSCGCCVKVCPYGALSAPATEARSE